MNRAFTMWSGGKDSHFGLFRAHQAGLRPELLVTLIDSERELVFGHELPPELIVEQARLIGIPIMKVRTTHQTYERDLRNLLFDLRSEGITRGVFGTVDQREHRDSIQELLSDFDMVPVFPLWGIPRSLLIQRQMSQMRSIIVQIDRQQISESYLGKDLNNEFIEYLQENDLDLTGSRGEYQTFVCRSPLAADRQIVLTHAERRATPSHISLDIDYWKVERTG